VYETHNTNRKQIDSIAIYQFDRANHSINNIKDRSRIPLDRTLVDAPQNTESPHQQRIRVRVGGLCIISDDFNRAEYWL
jgi:hypothetical protein